MIRSLLPLLTVLLITGCIGRAIDKTRIAKRQTERYYSLLDRNVDSALSLFDPKLYKNNSRAEMKQTLLEIRKRFGPATKRELVKTEGRAGTIKGEAYNVIHLYYKNTYSSGFVSVERFEFSNDDEGKDFELIDEYTFYEWGQAPADDK
jgi:hypothetical protein